MVVVLWAPLVLIAVAALAMIVVVKQSTLRITSDGVEIRNFPQPPRLIPLDQVGHFEATPRVGNFSSVRPATAVLVLVDGTRQPVRTVVAPDAGHGVEALNHRLETLRYRNG